VTMSKKKKKQEKKTASWRRLARGFAPMQLQRNLHLHLHLLLQLLLRPHAQARRGIQHNVSPCYRLRIRPVGTRP
jgi:hypothetical protein